MSLTQAVKAEAQRLGFQLVGVTTPDPPQHYAVFERWLEAGLHGEMAYLAAERSRWRRADPRRILPECRSILVLGLRYPAPGSLSPPFFPDEPSAQAEAGPRGRVSAYAWGVDYHLVMEERLPRLVAFIEAQIGRPVPNRWYCDTGPLLERDLAQRAGLGWIGKNTCLIHPRLGSYFFLAEVLLGVELDADPPFISDHCGTCTRCLDACPTHCIRDNRTLDATRCISYLTIEVKAAIPADLRSSLADWVFGCDVCQQVCPWNLRFATPQGDPAFAPLPGLPRPDLPLELSLTPQQFNRRYRSSPLKRARRRGYLRNVAVALGNSAHPRAAAPLAMALDDPEPLVRAHAAWALAKLGGETSRQRLLLALRREEDASVLEEIRLALEMFPSPSATT